MSRPRLLYAFLDAHLTSDGPPGGLRDPPRDNDQQNSDSAPSASLDD